MKHRWAPEGCAIVCGAAWLAALMGGGMLWMGISRLRQLPFCTRRRNMEWSILPTGNLPPQL